MLDEWDFLGSCDVKICQKLLDFLQNFIYNSQNLRRASDYEYI